MTATSITVSAPTDGECSAGMVQRFGGGPVAVPGGGPQELHAGRWHRCLSSQPARPSRVGNAPAAVASSRSGPPVRWSSWPPAAGSPWPSAVPTTAATAPPPPSGPSVEQVIDTVGTIASASRRDASFSVDGTVATVAVTVGQVVAAGDVLATLDTEALQDAVERAQADLADAQQQLSDDLDAQTSSSTTSSTRRRPPRRPRPPPPRPRRPRRPRTTEAPAADDSRGGRAPPTPRSSVRRPRCARRSRRCSTSTS